MPLNSQPSELWLASGLRTADIAAKGTKPSATAEMGTAVAKAL